jgi:hypothetical protein
MPLLENFRAVRWIRLANLVLQGILCVTLFAGLNYVAGIHPERFDLTRAGRYSLSPESVAYLRQLSRPVRIVVTQAEDAASPELRGLLREYAYTTEDEASGRISVEYLDIDLNRREAERLGIDRSDSILLLCGDNRRLLTLDRLYRTDAGGVQEFQGEQALTSAILDVSDPNQKRVYFLAGHGEPSLDSVDPTGLAIARDQLRQRNFHVEALDLSTARQVPSDAAVLIDVAPRTPFSPFEQELLRRYLSTQAGRLILFLAPGPQPTGLENLLLDWGVIADNDLVCDTGIRNMAEDGDLIVRDFRPHPAIAALADAGVASLRLGPTRTIRPDELRAANNGIDIATLALASPTAWGEVNPGGRTSPAYNPRIDLPPGRLSLAVAAEPVPAGNNLPFSVPRGRLIVFGTGDLIDNVRIGETGAIDVLLGAVNWTVDRDAQLHVPPRPIERFQLSLSAAELRNLRATLLFALPGATLLLGLVVYWTRRH